MELKLVKASKYMLFTTTKPSKLTNAMRALAYLAALNVQRFYWLYQASITNLGYLNVARLIET